MTVVSLPVTRPAGRTLLVAGAGCRDEVLGRLSHMGFACGQADDPYAAVAELAKRPHAYRSVVLSLQSLYREELQMIATLKQRWPHLDIWLTHTDGRAAAIADAIRLGADGLLTEDGLQRTAIGGSVSRTAEPEPVTTQQPATQQREAVEQGSSETLEASGNETVLSADELRALLQDPPAPLPRHAE